MSRTNMIGNLPRFIRGPNTNRLDRHATARLYGFSFESVFKAYNNWIQIFRMKESSLTFEDYLNKLKEVEITPLDVGNDIYQYHLSRFNDEGPYTKESCRFILKSENLKEEKFNNQYNYLNR